MNYLTPKHHAELKASCISDAIAQKYFRSIEGDEAQRYLIEDALGELGGHSTQYATRPVQRLMRQSEHVKAGGWACDANGQVKPDAPRAKWERDEAGQWHELDSIVKYEIIRERPYQGANVSAIWPIEQPVSDIRIGVEGSKKAASTASIGYASIGFPGNEMGLTAKNQDGDRFLIPALQEWAEQGVTLCLPLDQDEKASTRANNERAARSLASRYIAAGGKVLIAEWPIEFGKGIDDVQAAQGASCVHNLISTAMPFGEWQAQKLTEFLRSSKPELYKLTCDRDVVNQRYLSVELGERGTNLHISSLMETGKSVAIGGEHTDKIDVWGLKDEFYRRHPDGLFELQGYRNGLGQQSARKWGIDHISELGVEGTYLTQMLIDDASSLTYCLDSLNRRIRAIRSALADGRVVAVILDEGDAVLKHVLGGGTLGRRQAEIWAMWCETLAAVHAAGGYIIQAEANLPQIAVDAITEITGARPCDVRVVENTYQPHKGRKVIDYSALNADGKHSDQLLKKACFTHVRQLAARAPIFLATDTQGLGRLLEKELTTQGYKILRVDGDTKELPEVRAFLADPDGQLAEHQYNVVIGTTTMESGVSISAGPFKDVVLFGAHLEDRALAQLSGRVRGQVTIHAFVKERVRTFGDDADSFNVNGVLKEWQQTAADSFIAADVAQFFDAEVLKASSAATAGAEGERFHRLKATYQARTNISRFSLKYGVMSIFEGMGCVITKAALQPAAFDLQAVQAWDTAREAVIDEDAQEFIEAQLDKDVAWALRVQGSASSNRRDRVKAQKILLNADFPGLPLDHYDFVREEVIKGRCNRLRAHESAWLLGKPKVAKIIDLKSWKTQLENRFMVLPAIRKETAKVKTLAQSVLMEIAQLDSYEENTKLVVELADWAKGRAKMLGRLFRLQIKDTQTNIAIVSKLLRKIGYTAKCIAQPGSRGDQVRIWKAEAQPYQAEVWAALEAKWADELAAETIDVEQPQPRKHDLHKEENTLMQIVITTQESLIKQGKNPPSTVGVVAAGGLVPLNAAALDAVMADRKTKTLQEV